MATPFAAACDVYISNTYDTTGSLTTASLKRLAPSDFKLLYNPTSLLFHEMTALLRHQITMKACGIQRNSMYDWIMSSNRPGMSRLISPQKVDRGPSMIQPFIIGSQQSVISRDYWVITTGYPTSGGGAYVPGTGFPIASVSTGTINGIAVTAGADLRVIRVIAGYGIPLDTKYFLPRHAFYVLNLSAGSTALHTDWMIVDSAIDTEGLFIDILVKIQGPDSTTADLTPTTGVGLVGINDVKDFEKWCFNRPNINPEKRVPFWYQQYRWTRSVSSEYRRLFKHLMDDNAYFAEFGDLPEAVRNRQDELLRQHEQVHTLFYGRAISSAQRLEGSPNWTSLTSVTSFDPTVAPAASVNPGTGNIVMAYQAHLIGWYDQLKSCARVRDFQNGVLDIKNFLEVEIMAIHRARKSAGRPADSIDIWTDSISADQFMTAYIAYAKSKLGDIIRVMLGIGEGKNETIGWNFTSFKTFLPLGVKVNLFVADYFDDQLNTFATLPTGSQASRGRILAVLDLGKGGSMYPAVLGSNHKHYRSGEIEPLARVDASYGCVMENPTVERDLNSQIITAIMECPLNSLWVENYSNITFVA